MIEITILDKWEDEKKLKKLMISNYIWPDNENEAERKKLKQKLACEIRQLLFKRDIHFARIIDEYYNGEGFQMDSDPYEFTDNLKSAMTVVFENVSFYNYYSTIKTEFR